jgi:hypothetical protein
MNSITLDDFDQVASHILEVSPYLRGSLDRVRETLFSEDLYHKQRKAVFEALKQEFEPDFSKIFEGTP